MSTWTKERKNLGPGCLEGNRGQKLEELKCSFPLWLRWPVPFNKEYSLCGSVTLFISTELHQHQIMNFPRNPSDHNQREILK